MKRACKWIVGLLLTPVLLFVVLTALLYIPAIQNWAVNLAARAATEGTGVNVTVGRVGLSFPLDFDMRRVVATDDEGDSLLCADRIVIDLNLCRLLSSQLSIDELTLHSARVNTMQMIEGLSANGSLQTLSIAAPEGIDLKHNRVDVSSIALKGCRIELELGESAEDTTSTEPSDWKIAVRQISMDDVSVRLATDSLAATVAVLSAQAKGVGIDLAEESYAVGSLGISAMAQLEQADWCSMPIPIAVNMQDLMLHSTTLKLQELTAKLSGTELRAGADVCLTAFDAQPEGRFDANIDLIIPQADIQRACQLLDVGTDKWRESLPQEPFTLSLNAAGNTERVELSRAEATLPTVFSLQADGYAAHLLDSARMEGKASATLSTFDLTLLRPLLGIDRSIRLPQMVLDATATMRGTQMGAKAQLSVTGREALRLTADYDNATEKYNGRLDLTGLRLRQFMPSLPIDALRAVLRIDGRGTDYMRRDTRMAARMDVQHCRMDSIDLSDLCLTANYLNRRAAVLMDFNSPLLTANMGINAKVEKRDSVTADFALDLSRIDLYALGATQKPLLLGGTVHFDGQSNLTDSHELRGGMHSLTLTTPDTVFHPKNLDLDLLMRPDTLAAYASAGDLRLGVSAGQGLDPTLKGIDTFVATLEQQAKDYNLDQEALRLLLPTMTANIHMGQQNPVANIARIMGYTWHDFDFVLDARPERGLNGGGRIGTLNVGAMTLDTISWHIYQDTTGVKMDARVFNGPRNPQISFDARANAYILPTGAGLRLTYDDERGKRGVDLGAQIDNLPDGIRVQLTPLRPIVAYRRFEVNEGNYLMLTPGGRVEADLDLLADDGTRFTLYSTPDTSATTLQDLTASLHHLNVDELCAVLPYMPQMGGLLYGDVHLVQTTDNLSLALDSRIDGFRYEGASVGDVALNATYLPMGDSCHYVNALLSRNDEDIMLLDGTYTDDGADGLIDAQALVTRLPLEMVSGIVADPQTLLLGGHLNGELTVTGPVSRPVIDGYMATDKMSVAMPVYNFTLTAADDTMRMNDSRLVLDGLDFYSKGKRPLTMSGWVDVSDLSNIRLDTRVTANRFELINAKRTATAETYGKMLVDINAQLQGSTADMALRGRLGILGGTDLTYILMDSPLTVEDRLADLVTFTDFNDTLSRHREEEAASAAMNLTLNMQVNIEESAQLHCLLSADRSSYVDLEGGGTLMLSCTPRSDMMLTGRYTIQSGEMKYALPVIPLKTFELKNGSYVEWNGNILNPTLNITATERMRSAVGSESGQTRTVPFDVGLNITQTLENMGLAFTIDSPEDAAVQNELAQMDAAARGRVAVTMLATGMYITDNGLAAGGFSTTNALNTFLQSEIAGLTGKALRTVDVSVGVEEGTSAAGTSTTDYSFSFAKRFWNNRISVSFGGKVSSGADAQNTGATIIDNVSLEYRLDNSATRYVRLSYDKNYESLLEGTITEMGAGLVMRRKTTRLGDLFIFRRRKNQ